MLKRYTNSKIEFILFLLTVILLALFAMNEFHPGNTYLIGDDAPFHLRRFLAIKTAIGEGQFPFSIDSHSIEGYGYATNLFYPDFMLIPFAFLIDGLGLITSYKLMLFSAFLLCAFISFFSLNKAFKNRRIAFLGSLLYTFSFYRMADMSLRSALGEYLAFSFIPLILWGCYELLQGDYKRKWYILSIGFSCMILSHLMSAFITFLVAFVFIAIYSRNLIKEPGRILYCLLAGLVTMLLSALFLLPMFEQLSYNSFYFETAPFVGDISYQTKSIGITLKALLKEFFLHNNSYPNTYIGVGTLLVLPLFALLFIREKSKIIRFADISVLVGIALLIMISGVFPWQLFPFNKLSIIQFPWRFLQAVSFLFACSGGIYLCKLFSSPKAYYSLSAFVIVALALCLHLWSGAFKEVQATAYTNQKYDLNTVHYLGIGTEYLPSSVPSLDYLEKRGDEVTFENEDTKISNFRREGSSLKFDVKVEKTDKLVLPLLYYKGYKGSDGAMIANLHIGQSKEGLVEIELPKSGEVTVWYDGTLVQRLSWLISIVTLVALLVFCVSSRKKRTKI